MHQRHFNRAVCAAFSIIALLTLVTAAQAAVISVDWDTNPTNLAATDVAGAVPVNNWNVFTTSGNQTNLNDNSGTATTADFTTSILLFGPSGGGVGSPFPAGPDHNMMKEVVFDNAANVDPAAFITYLSFSQVPYSVFDLYIYSSANVSDRTATFRIGSDTEVKGTGNPSTFVQGQNYVLFSGLTASSFNVEARANAGTGFPQVVFNGFQIVEVPEPSSLSMLLGGFVGLCRIARKRRK